MRLTRTLTDQMLRLVQSLSPPYCILCQQTHNRPRPMCLTCQEALPRNQSACRRCASPLPQNSARCDHGSSTPSAWGNMSRLMEGTTAWLPSSGSPTCHHCRHTSPTFEETQAPYLMRGGIKELIHMWKFQHRPHLTPLLASLFVESAAHRINLSNMRHATLVPVPTQWDRRLRRGFDHTWLLAQALKQRALISNGVKSWLKTRQRRMPQHRLSRQERLLNADSPFIASHKIQGRDVIVIDDVITTGATASAAARACIEAGAQSVKVWCVAKTPAPGLSR